MVEPLYWYYGQSRSVDDRKCVALSEFLFRLFSRFRRHCGYAKLASNVTTQKFFFNMRPFRLKNRRLMENAQQNRHLQVPIQWLRG